MKLILAVAACITFFALPAFAREQYFSLAAGAWLPGHTSSVDYNLRPINTFYDPGWGVGGTIGVDFNNGLRVENEIVYRQAPAKGTTDNMWSFGWLTNVWWDIKNGSPITPYLGGGVGFGGGHAASPGFVVNTGAGIVYQAGGGVDFRIDRRMSLDIGYRYFGVADVYNRGVGDFSSAGSSIMGGLRVRF